MSWPKDMELIHISARGILVLGPESITQRFHLSQWQTSMTRRWTECRKGTWCWMSSVPWSSRMDLERFLLLGALLSTSRCHIFRMRIRKSTAMQDQSHGWTRWVLNWFRPSRGIIVIRPVLLYYAMKFDTPDRLQVTAFIVWRTVS
jgi:hypothetical protein